MPDRDQDENGRTEEERALDKALKDTFPASDPTGPGGGTATPRKSDRQLKTDEDDSEEEG